MSIRLRLFLAFLSIVGVGFYFLIDWVLDDLRPRYLATMEESMVDAATILAAFVTSEVTEDLVNTEGLRRMFEGAQEQRFRAQIYEVTKDRLNMQVYVTDKNGKVLFDSEDDRTEGQDFSQWNDVIKTLRGEYGARATWTDPDDPETSILHVASPISVDAEIVGVLTVRKPAESVTRFIETARNKVIAAGVVAGLCVILLGIVASVWIMSPIRKLTGYANAIRDGRRTASPAIGRSEMSVLYAAFEEMRDALEGKHYVENYVQTLTHEMKGPISAIRGAAELMDENMPADKRSQFLANIRAEGNRIQDVVDRLLALSSLEARKMLDNKEDMDLGEVIEEVIAGMEPVWVARGVDLEKELEAAVIVGGERALVREAVLNLLHNAIAYTPKGGTIRVGLSRQESRALITIRDTGPGIPDYALSRVFDRFYSLEHPETGEKSSGLGLTFVREIAALHGGDIRIENLPGGGTQATLSLPA